MSQLSFSSFDAMLLVRDAQGRYLPASVDQILSVARQAIDQKYQRGALFDAPEVVKDYLSTKLVGFEHEVFAALFMDSKHRLLEYVELFRGTIDQASVYPREVVKEALRINAAAVIFSHNHPSGNPEPSQADKVLTQRLKEALALVDGRYNSQVSYGQSRVQVVWNRIILPDTSSLTLDNLIGTDPAGYAGLEDGTDWHWNRVFAGAALTTLLGIGAELAAPENRQDGDRVIIAGRDGLQDSVNQVGQEMTRRNMNIQPTLTERPGLPVRIIVNRDLVLRPYQPLFFNSGGSR